MLLFAIMFILLYNNDYFGCTEKAQNHYNNGGLALNFVLGGKKFQGQMQINELFILCDQVYNHLWCPFRPPSLLSLSMISIHPGYLFYSWALHIMESPFNCC